MKFDDLWDQWCATQQDIIDPKKAARAFYTIGMEAVAKTTPVDDWYEDDDPQLGALEPQLNSDAFNEEEE